MSKSSFKKVRLPLIKPVIFLDWIVQMLVIRKNMQDYKLITVHQLLT